MVFIYFFLLLHSPYLFSQRRRKPNRVRKERERIERNKMKVAFFLHWCPPVLNRGSMQCKPYTKACLRAMQVLISISHPYPLTKTENQNRSRKQDEYGCKDTFDTLVIAVIGTCTTQWDHKNHKTLTLA